MKPALILDERAIRVIKARPRSDRAVCRSYAPQHLAAVPAVGGAGLGALLRAGAKPPKLPSFGRGVQPATVLCFLGPLWPIAQ